MNRLAVNLSMALIVALGLLGCDREEKPTGPQPSPAGPATSQPPALVSPHSGPGWGLPEPNDIALPPLLPGPSNSAVPRPSLDRTDLEQATEVVWGSMLGTEPSDPVVARLLADVPVLMSGIRQIKGRLYLYLGIGRAYYNRHGGEHIYNTLTKRFPTVPFYIEPSDGVQPLSATRAAPDNPASAAPAGKAVATVDAPSEPTNLRVEALTDTSARVRWDAVAAATDYDVNYRPEGGQWTNEPHQGTKLYNTIYDLKPSTAYRWAVRAENSDGYSNWVFGARFTTLAGEPGPGPNLTVPTITATPATVESGDQITIRVTVRNDGAAASDSQTITVYRHRAPTATPRVGGTYVVSGATGPLDAGASVTKRARISAPTVSSTTTHYYYACVDDACSSAATVTVRPEEVTATSDEGPGPDLIVQSPSVSTTTLTAGQAFTLQVTVHNQGDQQAAATTLRYYRSNNATITVSDTEVGTDAVAALDASASRAHSIELTAPHVSSPRVGIYYGACVASVSGERTTDNNCSPAVKTVVYEQETAEPEEPEPDDSTQVTVTPFEVVGEVDGGDPVDMYYNLDDVGYDVNIGDHLYGAGTLTLGGLTTTDGTKGFVISGHASIHRRVTVDDYANDKNHSITFGGWDEARGIERFRQFLGKVMQTPRPRRMGEFDDFFHADATFVAYPSIGVDNCSPTWTGDDTNMTYCLELGKGEQIETVTPLAIRGKGGLIYNVVGSQYPTKGLGVMFTGRVSGVVEGNQVINGKALSTFIRGEGTSYTYDFDGGGDSIVGDSGSPIYTVPDRNGNVRIVGILVGGIVAAGEDITVFSSWGDVMKELNLQPIR